MIDIERLRALARHWDEDEVTPSGDSRYEIGIKTGLGRAADELRELLATESETE